MFLVTKVRSHLQQVQERWYEKLHDWTAAQEAYERQQKKHPDNIEYTLGRMRCLEALGDWYVLFVCLIKKLITSHQHLKTCGESQQNLMLMCFRDNLYSLANEKWPQVTETVQQKMARMAAASAWGLGESMSRLFPG